MRLLTSGRGFLSQKFLDFELKKSRILFQKLFSVKEEEKTFSAGFIDDDLRTNFSRGVTLLFT